MATEINDRIKSLAVEGKDNQFKQAYMDETHESPGEAATAFLYYKKLNEIQEKKSDYNDVTKFATNALKSMSKSGTQIDIKEIKSVGDEINAIKEKGITSWITDNLTENVLLYLKQESDLLSKINEETSLTGKLSKVWRDEIMRAYPDTLKIGVTFDELSKVMSKMITEAGRFKIINKEAIYDLAVTGKAFFESVDAAVASLENFQKVSMGVSDMTKYVKDVGTSSMGMALNAKGTVKTIVENLEKLNQYGFKNGIEGLKTMVQKAQSLRMDMTDVFNIAENVMDPSKALEMASNLQVIGGAFGAFTDPLQSMYMATNDVEGLQDSLVKAAESLVTFNTESGRFEIVGANLRRARDMSRDLGMDLNKLTNLGVQSAQRASAATDILSRGFKIDEEEKEFLINMSQMKEGKMTISIPEGISDKLKADVKTIIGGETIALDQLNENQKTALFGLRKELKEMSPEDIARQQVTLVENLNRNLAFLAAKARTEIGVGAEEELNSLLLENIKGGLSVDDLKLLMGKGADDLGKFLEQSIKSFYNDLESALKTTPTGSTEYSEIKSKMSAIEKSGMLKEKNEQPETKKGEGVNKQQITSPKIKPKITWENKPPEKEKAMKETSYDGVLKDIIENEKLIPDKITENLDKNFNKINPEINFDHLTNLFSDLLKKPTKGIIKSEEMSSKDFLELEKNLANLNKISPENKIVTPENKVELLTKREPSPEVSIKPQIIKSEPTIKSEEMSSKDFLELEKNLANLNKITPENKVELLKKIEPSPEVSIKPQIIKSEPTIKNEELIAGTEKKTTKEEPTTRNHNSKIDINITGNGMYDEIRRGLESDPSFVGKLKDIIYNELDYTYFKADKKA